MKLLSVFLTLSAVAALAADSKESTNLHDRLMQDTLAREKRSLGVDENFKKDVEIKTKSGTSIKISKSVSYNDGGAVAHLPTLLDSIATNRIRVLQQLQNNRHHGIGGQIGTGGQIGIGASVGGSSGAGFDGNIGAGSHIDTASEISGDFGTGNHINVVGGGGHVGIGGQVGSGFGIGGQVGSGIGIGGQVGSGIGIGGQVGSGIGIGGQHAGGQFGIGGASGAGFGGNIGAGSHVNVVSGIGSGGHIAAGTQIGTDSQINGASHIIIVGGTQIPSGGQVSIGGQVGGTAGHHGHHNNGQSRLHALAQLIHYKHALKKQRLHNALHQHKVGAVVSAEQLAPIAGPCCPTGTCCSH